MAQAQHNAPVLKLDYRGAPQTIGVILDGALRSQEDLSVRTLAERITANVANKDFLSEILAVYHFVLPDRHVRYQNDPRTVELVRAPHVVAREILAGDRPGLDCDDLVALLVALLLAIGREVRIVTVAFRHAFYQGERQFSHVYCQAREPRSGQWITLDPVAAEETGQMLERAVAFKYWPVA